MPVADGEVGMRRFMNAEKYGLDRIYFGGCFIRGHAATIATLSYAIRFWSKGTKRALFLRHEGFLCVHVLSCLSNHPTTSISRSHIPFHLFLIILILADYPHTHMDYSCTDFSGTS